MSIDIISFLFAIMVAAGGVLGYIKADSIPSLTAGLVFGIVLAIGAYLTSKDPSNYYVLLLATVVLGGMMGWRYYNSGNFMPSGLITILSILMILRIGLRALGVISFDDRIHL